MYKAKTVYFKHIYFTSGFNVSKELISDGKKYIAPKRHACLRSGYWCWKNVLDNPLDILVFIWKKYEYRERR